MDIEILEEFDDSVVDEIDINFDVVSREELEQTKEIDVSAINDELEKTMSVIIGDEDE